MSTLLFIIVDSCYSSLDELHSRIWIKPLYVGPEGLPAPVLRNLSRCRPGRDAGHLPMAPFNKGIYCLAPHCLDAPYSFHQVRLRQIEVHSYFKKAHTLLPLGPYSDADIIVLISEAGMLWSYGKYGSRNGG